MEESFPFEALKAEVAFAEKIRKSVEDDKFKLGLKRPTDAYECDDLNDLVEEIMAVRKVTPEAKPVEAEDNVIIPASVTPEPEQPGTDAEVAGKKFLIENQKVLLTYKHHINKADLTKFLNNLADGNIDKCIVAHETGDPTNNYLHTHVVAVCKKGAKFRSTNARFFDFPRVTQVGNTVVTENIHPHIRKIGQRKKDIDACIMYVTKEDPELADLREQMKEETIPLVDKVNSFETSTEMLRALCKKPSEAPGLMKLWEITHKARLPEQKPWEPRGWQIQLLERLKGKPFRDDRKVIWIYDEEGNSGKSEFFRRCVDIWPGKVWKFGGWGSDRDVGYITSQMCDQCAQPHLAIVDLPRQSEKYDGMYSAFEKLKNGEWAVTKYAGKAIEFTIPHLVILANFLPKVKDMSSDRWEIYEILTAYVAEVLGKNHNLQHAKDGAKIMERLDYYEVLNRNIAKAKADAERRAQEQISGKSGRGFSRV